MAIKVYKPTSPGRRGMTSNAFEEVTQKKSKPEKSLTVALQKHGGRNHHGRRSRGWLIFLLVVTARCGRTGNRRE